MMARQAMTLETLVTQLASVHGGALTAVVLYGSAASDEAVSGRSDQNVLVIVEQLSVETLRALSQTARAWQEAGNPPPLTLTRTEWLRSADIFPMEYADILERHRVLSGTLPLEGITIHPSELRLQTEQEAMGKLLRLRRAVMAAGTDAKREIEVLTSSFSALLVIFRAVLRLHGERPPRDALAVIRAVGQHAGFDTAAFARVAGLVRGETLPDRDANDTLAAYLRGMDALVLHLDRFAPAGTTPPGTGPVATDTLHT